MATSVELARIWRNPGAWVRLPTVVLERPLSPPIELFAATENQQLRPTGHDPLRTFGRGIRNLDHPGRDPIHPHHLGMGRTDRNRVCSRTPIVPLRPASNARGVSVDPRSVAPPVAWIDSDI